MSSSQDSETKRVAISKVQEAWFLLAAGNYDGAVAASTEAIELDPRRRGAYQLRAVAHKHLSRGQDAEADLAALRDL